MNASHFTLAQRVLGKVCFDAPHQNGSGQYFDNFDKLTRWHCLWFIVVSKRKLFWECWSFIESSGLSDGFARF